MVYFILYFNAQLEFVISHIHVCIYNFALRDAMSTMLILQLPLATPNEIYSSSHYFFQSFCVARGVDYPHLLLSFIAFSFSFLNRWCRNKNEKKGASSSFESIETVKVEILIIL